MENTWKYYDDDGNEINPNLLPKPSLCAICKHNADSKKQVLCNLSRLDFALSKPENFECHDFEKD